MKKFELTAEGVLNDFNELCKEEIKYRKEFYDKASRYPSATGKKLSQHAMESGFLLARVLGVCFSCNTEAKKGECDDCMNIRKRMQSLFKARPYLDSGLPANMRNYILTR